MTALLTDNLPLLAGAPNGIKKLRELILELAVRGKLVEQDTSDEPASELLKRIAAERARLVTEGKIRRLKPVAEIAEEELKHFLPVGWVWARNSTLFSLRKGRVPKDLSEDIKEFPYLDIEALDRGNIRRYTDDRNCPQSTVHDLLVVCDGSRSGLILDGRNGAIGSTLSVIDTPIFIQYFVRLIFAQSYERLNSTMKGAAIPHLDTASLMQEVIGLPPIAEQQRIVAKVKELMALCDRLETQQADAASAHAQLVQALLGSLTQASDAADFAASWQRLTEHFHTLFSTEPSIDALKKALLQLAVMGKLVPQDPTDEPASELLKRIEVERERLVAEGKIKKQKPSADIVDHRAEAGLPSGWEWVCLSDVSTLITDGTHQTPKYVDEGLPFLSAQNVKPFKFMPNIHRFVSVEDFELLRKNRTPELGDILMTRVGAMIGEAAVIDTEIDFAFYVSLALIKVPKELCSPDFIVMWLNSPFGTALSIRNTLGRGVSAGNLNLGLIRAFEFGFPPLAEQHRIVAKLDQLMALCDQLKTQLSQAHQLNGQLASTLVERALVDGNKVAATAINQGKARTLLAAEIVQKLHGEKRMGRVKLQKIISLAEHVARLKEIQSDEQRYAAGPHDPALMNQVAQGLRASQWFEELALEAEVGKRYEYRPLAQAGTHRPAYEALWSAQQRRQVSELIELMRLWDTPRCERVATLYSAWNDLLIEGREATEAAILHEVLRGWNDSKLKFTETQWLAELVEMKKHSFLIPTGFGKRTTGGVLRLPGFE